MKFFTNLSVKKKLVSVFSVICIFIILIGVEGIISSSKINKGSKSIYSDSLVSIKDLEEIKAISNDGTANMLRIVFERDRTKLDKQIEVTANLSNEIDKWEKEYDSLATTSKEEDKIYGDFINDSVKYREVRTKVIELVKANNFKEAVKINNLEMVVLKASMLEKLNKCIAINNQSAQKANLANIAQYNKVGVQL